MVREVRSTRSAAIASVAPKHKVSFLIKDSITGQRISRQDATQTEGQYSLDLYYKENGEYPNAYLDGVYQRLAGSTNDFTESAPASERAPSATESESKPGFEKAEQEPHPSDSSAFPEYLSTTKMSLSAEQSKAIFDVQMKREEAALRREEAAEARAQEADVRAKQLHDAQLLAATAVRAPEKHTAGELEYEEDEGETSPETRLLQSHIFGVKKSYLIAITKNKFPENSLCKLIPGSSNGHDTATTSRGW